MSSRSKRARKAPEPSIEDIYKNKNFILPKEKTLETIFEEPKISKEGTEQLVSNRKVKRFLHFNDKPSSEKLRRRRKRAKKYAKHFIDLTVCSEDEEQIEQQLDNIINEAVIGSESQEAEVKPLDVPRLKKSNGHIVIEELQKT